MKKARRPTVPFNMYPTQYACAEEILLHNDSKTFEFTKYILNELIIIIFLVP